MNALRKQITTGIIAVLGSLSLTAVASAQSSGFPLLTAPGDVQMELIGEVINSAPGVSPPTSLQFGYISRINGIDNVFTGTPQNETTAIFTFVTHATTIRKTVHGPLVILAREGTTTIYCNNAPKISPIRTHSAPEHRSSSRHTGSSPLPIPSQTASRPPTPTPSPA